MRHRESVSAKGLRASREPFLVGVAGRRGAPKPLIQSSGHGADPVFASREALRAHEQESGRRLSSLASRVGQRDEVLHILGDDSALGGCRDGDQRRVRLAHEVGVDSDGANVEAAFAQDRRDDGRVVLIEEQAFRHDKTAWRACQAAHASSAARSFWAICASTSVGWRE